MRPREFHSGRVNRWTTQYDQVLTYVKWGLTQSLVISSTEQNTGGFVSGKRANRERAGFLPAKQNQCLPMTVNCTDAEWESVPLFPTTAKV
jgi:hypothetical protein